MKETELNTIPENNIDNTDFDNENQSIIKIPNNKDNIFAELRVAFQSELPKLNNANTRTQAYTQLKKLISSNTTPEALRIYINSLTSYYGSCTFQAKELIIIAYGYLANIYRDSLLDPLDKPPSITKTLNRLLLHIRTMCIKDNSYIIHKACSHTIIDFLELCTPKNQLKSIMTLFIEPFILLAATSVNLHIKEGSTVYLNDLVYHLGKKKDAFSLTILTNIAPSLLELICKGKSDLKYIYECLLNLLQALPFEYFNKRIKDIICSMVNVLKHETYSYQTRINCLNVLRIIGKRIFLYQIPLEGKDTLFDVMRYYLKDRNHKVQLAAQAAIKNWNMIQKDYFLDDLCNDQKIRNKKDKAALSMIKKVHQGKIKEFEQFDSELPEEMREDVYNKGISDVLKLSSFIKNHSKLNRNNLSYYDATNNNSNTIKRHLNHRSIRKYDEVNQMPFNSKDDDNNNSNDYNNKHQFIEDTVKGAECVPFLIRDTEIIPTRTNKRHRNAFSISKILSLINLKEINNSAQEIKGAYSSLEKAINKKVYQIEEKINSINDYFKQNTPSIIKWHNNNLDETECDMNDKTEIDIPIYDTMPFDDNMNDLSRSSFTQDTYLLAIWMKALNEIKRGQIENGFNRIVALGDDIYLLRLLLIGNGDMAKLLSHNLSKNILLRINKINRSHQIEEFLFESISQVIDNKTILNQLNVSDVNEILQTLSQYSFYNNNVIASKANELYESLISLYR